MLYPIAVVFSVSHEARVLMDMHTSFRRRKGSWKRGNGWNDHSMGRHYEAGQSPESWQEQVVRGEALSVCTRSHSEESAFD